MPSTDVNDSFVDQALANLVDQFARPLDLLRELVQNALDAGTPRIDVWTSWHPPAPGDTHGWLRIGVEDHGEGMDERIIDDQLTRLFASSKEDDATKIGKFGIGFTSVFAIRPEAVLLRTGRHGESWELLFHPDRSFDKIRLSTPVVGTSVVLVKHLPATELERWRHEIRQVLGYWCEHSRTPITFEHRLDPTDTPAETVDTDDPFSLFEATSDVPRAERVDRPLAIEAPLSHTESEPGTTVVIAHAEPARYGWFNGGLTLLHTSSIESLGPHADRLRHLSFKVEHDRLEHTLTRDNVLMDEHWARALGVVVRAAAALRARTADRLEDAVDAAAPVGLWQQSLAAELRSGGGPASATHRGFVATLGQRRLFSSLAGTALTLDQVLSQARRTGLVLVQASANAVTEALAAEGLQVLRDEPRTRELVELLLQGVGVRAELASAERVFVVPDLVADNALEAGERQLLQATESLLRVAVGLEVRVPGTETVWRWVPEPDSATNRLVVRVGDFGGPELGAADVLCLNGPPDARLFLRPKRRSSWTLPGFLQRRCLLVNRQHPAFRAHLLAWADAPVLAAHGLASALLTAEDLEGEPSHRRLLEASLARLGATS